MWLASEVVGPVVPQVQDQIYEEVVDQGWFSARPDVVRAKWSRLGTIAVVASLVALGLLVALDPFGVFFGNLLLTETLFTALALLFTAFAWAVGTRGPRGAPLLGLALTGALVILTRPSAAAWVPLVWLAVGWQIWHSSRRSAAWRIGLCPVVLALLLLPWGLRNRAVLGDCAWLSTNGGVTLYDAQGPQADGSSNQAFMQALPQLAGLDEVARDRELRRLAQVSIITHSCVCGGASASAAWQAWMSAGELTLGTSTASGPAAAIAARSAAPHSVPSALARITSSRSPNPPSNTAAIAASRAASLCSGATASSRSRITTSHGRVRALASAFALEAGR